MRVINRLANDGPNFNEYGVLVVMGPAEEVGKVEVCIESSESAACTVTVDGNQLIKAVQNAMNW